MRIIAVGLFLIGLTGCKPPEVAATEARQSEYARALQKAHHGLATDRFDVAIQAAEAALTLQRDSVEPHRVLAEAHIRKGNDGEAILALKRAAEVIPDEAPTFQKEMIRLHRRNGQTSDVITLLRGLAQQSQLNEDELLELARLEGRRGRIEEARQVLAQARALAPDSRESEVVEAELLMAEGEELTGARRLDALVRDYGLKSARLSRARYFLNGGYAAYALKDVLALPKEDRAAPTVVTLHARILWELDRHDDAEELLQRALEKTPNDPDLLTHLAEVKLLAGKGTDASALVDQALALRPRLPRALYVRGRAAELLQEWGRAAENYGYALDSDPGFGPALSRLWQVHQQQGHVSETMTALERLVLAGQASSEEKAALAGLYAKSKIHVETALKLVREAMQKEPKNQEYRTLERQILKLRPRAPVESKPNIIIMRGGR